MLKYRYIFLLTILFSCTMLGQQEANKILFSAGGGIATSGGDLWKLTYNVGASTGYVFSPNISLLAGVDYNKFSYDGYFQGRKQEESRQILSLLCEGKYSFNIPEHSFSPYIRLGVGYSHTSSSTDTIYSITNTGSVLALHISSGSSASFVFAVGGDVRLTDKLSMFLELRSSRGTETNLYDTLLLLRTGIGLML